MRQGGGQLLPSSKRLHSPNSKVRSSSSIRRSEMKSLRSRPSGVTVVSGCVRNCRRNHHHHPRRRRKREDFQEDKQRKQMITMRFFTFGGGRSSAVNSAVNSFDAKSDEEDDFDKNVAKSETIMGIECESGISYDENLVGLTKPIAFALFKHKTQAVITLGIVLLFSTADRTIFTLAALPIANELGLSIAQIGWIQNVFLIGYMSTNVIGGQLATSKKSGSISPSSLLFLALFFWSLAVSGVADVVVVEAAAVCYSDWRRF